MRSQVAALRLDGLCKSFGRILAVDDLSLQVRPGEMVGFLGPNGAGKSTTLYMIVGLVRASGGRVTIFGRNVRRQFKQAMANVGAMVETPAFYEYLSGRKNVELAARLRRNVTDERIDRVLDQIGLTDRQHDKVRTYSQGMKQRLGLGIAFLSEPMLLLLDEPTTGLDPEATRDILTMLREKVQNEGLAVFLSSHLLYEVEEFCDRVAVINRGRLVASGSVRQILAPHENVINVTFSSERPDCDALMQQERIERVVAVGDDTLEITLDGTDAAWLNDLLVHQGSRVSALVPKKKTLKDFFLSVTGEQ